MVARGSGCTVFRPHITFTIQDTALLYDFLVAIQSSGTTEPHSYGFHTSCHDFDTVCKLIHNIGFGVQCQVTQYGAVVTFWCIPSTLRLYTNSLTIWRLLTCQQLLIAHQLFSELLLQFWCRHFSRAALATTRQLPRNTSNWPMFWLQVITKHIGDNVQHGTASTVVRMTSFLYGKSQNWPPKKSKTHEDTDATLGTTDQVNEYIDQAKIDSNRPDEARSVSGWNMHWVKYALKVSFPVCFWHESTNGLADLDGQYVKRRVTQIVSPLWVSHLSLIIFWGTKSQNTLLMSPDANFPTNSLTTKKSWNDRQQMSMDILYKIRIEELNAGVISGVRH